MSRARRLLDLLQILRTRRAPVSGQTLADETGVSLRTLYRDIATLQAQGADIGGEPGLGYVLKSNFTLPPLMLSRDELDALILGAKFVARNAEAELADAAVQALAKIEAVVPPALRESVEAHPLLVPPRKKTGDAFDPTALMRSAIRRERSVRLDYRDQKGALTSRIVWPIALAYFDAVRMCACWCETRGEFRHFRIDRMVGVEIAEQRYPVRRAALVRQWREIEGIPEGA